jgi:hypothetical protein
MEFETLRLMAQDYADWYKEPSPLPATIDTMAYAYQRICQGEDPWTALGDFSNAWYSYAKHIRPDLVKNPLIRPAQETEATRRWGAFCAASVEYLCELHHHPCPQWVHGSSSILDTPSPLARPGPFLSLLKRSKQCLFNEQRQMLDEATRCLGTLQARHRARIEFARE